MPKKYYRLNKVIFARAMIKTLPILCFFLLGIMIPTESKFSLIKSIPAKATFFTTDNLGNSYIIAGNTLEKYNPDGSLFKTYSDKNWGAISLLDASNPLKLLVFYEPFQQMAILDNMLSPSVDPIQFQSLGYNQISLVASSHDNGTWIYNKQNFELIRFDQNFQPTHQTGNIAQLLVTKINPNFLIQQNNKVFLNDSTKGVFVFDIYGTFNKIIPIKGLTHFQINNDLLVFFNNGTLNSYNMKTLEAEKIALPDTIILDARSEKEKLYLLKKKQLDIYKVLP